MKKLNARDGNAVRRALALIQEDADGTFTCSVFDRLAAADTASAVVRRGRPYPAGPLKAVATMTNELKTISEKVRWLRQQRDNRRIGKVKWMYFCGSDIVAFHVLTRSLFDELALVVKGFASTPEAVPRSFNKLRTWAQVPANASTLGTRLARAVACDWFPDLREVRDDLVHRGAQFFAFPHSGRVLFQVSGNTYPKIVMPAVMHNENAVDFDLYAALIFARVTQLLERIATAAFASTALERPPKGRV